MTGNKGNNRSFSFTSILERSDNKLWGCHFSVPKKIAEQLIDGESKRVICTLNKRETYQCAILHYEKGRTVISVKKAIRDSLRLTAGTEVNVILKKDTSEYGLPLPEELAEVLRQDQEGKRLFRGLTRGKQRTLLYIAGNVEDTGKRIARSLAIVRHLKENKGTIDYKKLNILLKDPRA